MKPHASIPALDLGEWTSPRFGVILLHGRGSSAAEIARLWPRLAGPEVAAAVPQAAGNSWYPHRFHAALERNEPFLGSAVEVVEAQIARLRAAGVPMERIALAGFSQGACLALETLWRRPRPLLAIAAWSGARPGLLHPRPLTSALASLPVLLSCSEGDALIPIEHVRCTGRELREYGAWVEERVRPGSDHTVQREDVEWLRRRLVAPQGDGMTKDPFSERLPSG